MAFQYDSRSEVVWLNKHAKLPDTCCSCGMFTHNRVTVKHLRITTGKGKPGGGLLFFVTLILHIFGPIGWIVSMLLEGNQDENKTRTVKEKSKIKISQCTMCHATEPPTITESNGSSFAFLVHPLFKTRLDEARRLEDEN